MSIAAATTEHGEESTAALPLHSTAPPPHFTLYTYWRSSCTWRVRIALNYKQLTYTPQYINLLKGEHKSEEYGRVNPAHALPTLAVSYAETQQQLVLGESLAIMEWLEETHPTPPLLPTEPSQSNEQPTSQPAVHSKAVHQRSQSNASRRDARAKVRQLALILVAGTQPLTNLKLRDAIFELTGKEEEKQKWVAKWVDEGLTAYEHAISFTAGTYSFGNNITIADLCLVPQLYNARQYGVDLSKFPNVSRIEAELNKHPACIAAHPDAQPDNPSKQK